MDELMNVTILNGSSLQLNTDSNITAEPAKENETGLSAFLYIVAVMLFYATAMVVLVVKYLNSENREASLRRLYKDFIDRDDFLESYMMSERRKTVFNLRQTFRLLPDEGDIHENNQRFHIDTLSKVTSETIPKCNSFRRPRCHPEMHCGNDSEKISGNNLNGKSQDPNPDGLSESILSPISAVDQTVNSENRGTMLDTSYSRRDSSENQICHSDYSDTNPMDYLDKSANPRDGSDRNPGDNSPINQRDIHSD